MLDHATIIDTSLLHYVSTTERLLATGLATIAAASSGSSHSKPRTNHFPTQPGQRCRLALATKRRRPRPNARGDAHPRSKTSHRPNPATSPRTTRPLDLPTPRATASVQGSRFQLSPNGSGPSKAWFWALRVKLAFGCVCEGTNGPTRCMRPGLGIGGGTVIRYGANTGTGGLRRDRI